MTSTTHDNGWISLVISPEWEEQAKAMRRERDARYGNIYAERATDERWVGDLGEFAFKSWLNHCRVPNFKWHVDDVAGRADFELSNGLTIGVKTVKRQVAPQAGYTMQITAQHAHEPVEQFFFLTYQIPTKTMWFLGGISRARFLECAVYYGAGEWVHPKYQVREGHEIYNADIGHFQAPAVWLERVQQDVVPHG